MRITAPDLLQLGVIDEIVPEPIGGAHRNWEETAENLRGPLRDALWELRSRTPGGAGRRALREVPQDRRVRGERLTAHRCLTGSGADANVSAESFMPKLHLITYGCQMNEYDSERVAGLLKRQRYELTEGPEDADLILLNTCAIREKAEDKVFSRSGRSDT